MLVRLHASGVCHSDQNAIDGTAETRCPAVLGHEGAGVVEAVGPRVTRVRPGDHVALSWAPSCGECAECLRELPHLCATAWPAMGAGGLLDGTTRLSRDGEPVYHYSFISSFAEASVVPERSCVPIPRDVPFAIAGLVGCAISTGIGAVWRTAGVRPGDRVAIVGCGGVGLSALLGAVAAGRGRDRRGRRDRREARRRARARRDGRRPLGGLAGGDRRGRRRGLRRRRRLRDRGDRAPRGDARRRSSPRARAARRC